MFDLTVRLDTMLLSAGFVIGGWRLGVALRDRFRALDQTVYGSIKPPIEGLVKQGERHERIIRELKYPEHHRGSSR